MMETATTTSTVEIINRGVEVLLKQMGALETERFISVILRERFDYTKWRQQYCDDMDPDAFNNAAADYVRKNPFVPKHIENVNGK